MPRCRGHLRILFSARVLLNLEDAHHIYAQTYQDALQNGENEKAARARAVSAYNDYVSCRGAYKDAPYEEVLKGRRFEKGALFDFACALARLNQQAEKGEPLVELGLSAKDEALSGITIFRNIDTSPLGDLLDYRLLTCGRAVAAPFHQSFGTDLFLSRNPQDVQTARDIGVASALIHYEPLQDQQNARDEKGAQNHNARNQPLKIMVDGDGVAWGEQSEMRFQQALAQAPTPQDGLSEYLALEDQEFAQAIAPGPFTRVLEKISRLNDMFPREEAPFEISLLTARGGRASTRALTTLVDHDIALNGFAEFKAGAAKEDGLRAHQPHLYFDDQQTHLAQGRVCPAGLVFYVSDSPLKKAGMGAV